MNPFTHYMIHCAATPEGKPLTGNDILWWHMLPLPIDGKYKYKGKLYNSVAELPNEKIAGKDIKTNFGSKGWTRPGYSEIILLNGDEQIIWPVNDDNFIDAYEVTNGILSTNPLYRKTKHVCYIGGTDLKGRPKDTRTAGQHKRLEANCFEMITKHPAIKIIGHNQVNSDRACPSFNVPAWCRKIGIPEKNIDDRPILWRWPLS